MLSIKGKEGKAPVAITHRNDRNAVSPTNQPSIVLTTLHHPKSPQHHTLTKLTTPPPPPPPPILTLIISVQFLFQCLQFLLVSDVLLVSPHCLVTSLLLSSEGKLLRISQT